MPTYEELIAKTDQELADMIEAGGHISPTRPDEIIMSPALAAAIILLGRKDQLIQALVANKGNKC